MGPETEETSQGRAVTAARAQEQGGPMSDTYKDLGYDKVFVSLDGSEQQDAVLERAMTMAANNHAALYIGHVVDEAALETSGANKDERVAELEQEFRASIADAVERAETSPDIRSVEVVVESGHIRETLKESMLDVIEPDIVICGARGLSSIKYALLGSISTFLLRNCECDILVIK